LKSAKKEKKDIDEDDLAFKEKQRAGMFLGYLIPGHKSYASTDCLPNNQMPRPRRT
jgi:hypothetical protein